MNMPPELSPPFLGQPNEICIVTPNLRETLSGLLRLGIGPFKIFHFTPESVSDQTINGVSAPFAIDVAFSEPSANGIVWEIMQPVHGQTLMQDFLDSSRDGKGGIQHVAFDCATASSHENGKENGKNGWVGEAAHQEALRRRKEFEERGFVLAMSGIWRGRQGSTCEFMFFDTFGAVSTCFETYVFSDDWEDPEDVEIFPPIPSDMKGDTWE